MHSTFPKFRKRDKEAAWKRIATGNRVCVDSSAIPWRLQFVELLAENKELNPSEIARAVGRSVQRVSTVLGALRLAEVVRYDTDGKHNRYRLKHPSEVRNVLASLSRFVKVASVVAASDR